MSFILIETTPRSPFEALWRSFPQLKNATCVDRVSYAGAGRHGVVRTFRLLDGTYLCLHSWGTEGGASGTTVETIPADQLAVYEGTWRAMAARGRLYDPDPDGDEPHGMRFASREYRDIVCEEMESLSGDGHAANGDAA